jgi:hypothetical protein
MDSWSSVTEKNDEILVHRCHICLPNCASCGELVEKLDPKSPSEGNSESAKEITHLTLH